MTSLLSLTLLVKRDNWRGSIHDPTRGAFDFHALVVLRVVALPLSVLIVHHPSVHFVCFLSITPLNDSLAFSRTASPDQRCCLEQVWCWTLPTDAVIFPYLPHRLPVYHHRSVWSTLSSQLWGSGTSPPGENILAVKSQICSPLAHSNATIPTCTLILITANFNEVFANLIANM